MLSPEEVEKKKQEIALRREYKRQRQRRQRIMYLFLILLALVLMCLSAYYSYQKGKAETTLSYQALPDNRRIHILFLGTDKKFDRVQRTDTMMLVSVDPDSGSVGIISIPRDTRVYLPSLNKWDRVNTAYTYGGPKLVKETVARLLDVPVDYYVKTDFDGFRQIIDTLGGVVIEVEREMFYVDNAQDLHIHLLPGRQVLDGDKALQYVRYRDRLGDISLVNQEQQVYAGRVERQRKLLLAVVDKLLEPNTLLKLPKLVGQFWNMVETDLPWNEVVNLVLAAGKFSSQNVQTAVLPGNSDVVNGAWYWVADDVRVKELVSSVLGGSNS